VAKVVVGVDASPGALRALAWAADEARLRLASLQVVHAYHAQALAAPLYFPSREGLPVRAVAAGGRPPEEEMTETLEETDLTLLEGLRYTSIDRFVYRGGEDAGWYP